MNQQEKYNREDFMLRLRKMRDVAGLSARALSLKIDMNEGYINRLESGSQSLPSMEAFFEMLDACNYSAVKFFYDKQDSFEDDMEIVNLIKNLSNEEKQALALLLRSPRK